MAAITADGQSFMIDGRRLWLVTGTIPYARVPRDEWAQRIAEAKEAGLNCIETPVIWSLHEPREGVFEFSTELDLAAFVKTAGEAGLHVMLRIGPYVGPGWDLGGLPPWLLPICGDRLRSSAPEFLAACARYFGAVCAQVRDLQVSSSRRGKVGPIILVQAEHQWYCGDPEEGAAYLGELDRYLRENGISVPIVNTTNLFHPVEGQISVWSSGSHFHSTIRQLRAVEPNHPGLSIVPASTVRAVWGEKWGSAPPAGSILRALAEVLAAGGQYILTPFHAGSHFGFMGGRYGVSSGGFATSDPEPDAPLDGAGRRSSRFDEVRRISLFASRFGRVLASLDQEYKPVVVALEPTPLPDAKPAAGCITAVDCRGSQGSVVFVFGPPEGGQEGRTVSTTLDDGSYLPVTLGRDPVTWVLRGVHLVGRSSLDYCNLSVVALAGTSLVMYGPARAQGLLSINGSALEVKVPSGSEPLLEKHEGITLVVCNESSIDGVRIQGDELFVNAVRIDGDGVPVIRSGARAVRRIDAAGEWSRAESREASAKRGSVGFRTWQVADCAEHVSGEADRYALIDGPMTMESLGTSSGYGWVRLGLRSSGTRKLKAGFFESGDRLHLYESSSLLGVIGEGPGAAGPVADLTLRKGQQTLTLLIDNLGRLSEGIAMGEAKGLYGHVWKVAAIRTAAPKIVGGSPVAPLAARSPIFGLERGDVTDADRLTWSITHRRRSPIVMCIGADVSPGVVLVNDVIVHVLRPGGGDRLMLDTDEHLKRGVNSIQIAVVGSMREMATRLKGAVTFRECEQNLTEKATWAFAKWEPPPTSRFEVLPKSRLTPAGIARLKGSPHWWKGEFTPKHADAPLYFDARGLSKGQLFLNGRNLGRFFVATAGGKTVPPQSLYHLPTPWLEIGKSNALTVFDEHGFGPTRCKLVYGSSSG